LFSFLFFYLFRFLYRFFSSKQCPQNVFGAGNHWLDKTSRYRQNVSIKENQKSNTKSMTAAGLAHLKTQVFLQKMEFMNVLVAILNAIKNVVSKRVDQSSI